MANRNFVNSRLSKGFSWRDIPMVWWALAVLLGALALQAQSRPDVVSVNLQNVSPLQGVLRFAVENRIPLGVVLSPQAGLCDSTKTVTLKNVPIGRVFDGLLAGSDYGWFVEDGVFVVRPRTLPASSANMLGLKFEQFTGMKTTIQGLGIILAGYIHGKLRPDEGYAGDILASNNAESVGPLDLRDVTVKQIANQIVSLDGKGAWILYPVPEDPARAIDARRLYVYGYSDDSRVLTELSCANP